MNQQTRELLLCGNEWIENTDANKYGLILTDDIDSLLSCALLKKVKNYEIDKVLLFRLKGKDVNVLARRIDTQEERECIGVDLALTQGKCYDNHLQSYRIESPINNENINLNRVLHRNAGIYSSKYNLNTVLLLWSLYDLPKTGLSEELMMFLLSIDSAFMNFYNSRYKYYTRFYLCEHLQLHEFYACLTRHEYQEFIDIAEKYKITKKTGKIDVLHGYLNTNMDIDGINALLREVGIVVELPKSKFTPEKKFLNVFFKSEKRKEIDAYKKKTYTHALINKNTMACSIDIDTVYFDGKK